MTDCKRERAKKRYTCGSTSHNLEGRISSICDSKHATRQGMLVWIKTYKLLILCLGRCDIILLKSCKMLNILNWSNRTKVRSRCDQMNDLQSRPLLCHQILHHVDQKSMILPKYRYITSNTSIENECKLQSLEKESKMKFFVVTQRRLSRLRASAASAALFRKKIKKMINFSKISRAPRATGYTIKRNEPRKCTFAPLWVPHSSTHWMARLTANLPLKKKKITRWKSKVVQKCSFSVQIAPQDINTRPRAGERPRSPL